MRIKRYVHRLAEQGLVVTIRDRVRREYEAAKELKRHDGRKCVLLENVEGCRYPLVGNFFFSRRVVRYVLGASGDSEAYNLLLSAMREPVPPRRLVDPPNMRDISLLDLPILKFYERDAGPYLTSGIIVARDPEGGFQNASIHRMLVLDDRHLAVRVVPRHLYRMYEKARSRGEDLPVVVLVGAPPEAYLAASSSPPYGVDELHVANALAGGRLDFFREEETGLVIPADVEVVIVGRLLCNCEANEGPFTDITGTYDVVRKQPVLEIDRVLAREDAAYYTILPASAEHRVLMGYPREAAIWRSVSAVARVKAVRLTAGGCGWLHAVISIEKRLEGEPKNVILAALAAHPSLKLVIVVDSDVDVDNPVEVEWALATRMQPDEDIVIIRGARGSSLDPSADQERLLTAKWGIDATRPLDKPREWFERARIP